LRRVLNMGRQHPPGVVAVFRVPVKITWAVVLGLASAAVLLVSFKLPERREEIKFAISVLAGAAVLYSAYYAGTTLRRSSRMARITAAFGILKELNSIDMAKIRTLIDKELKDMRLSPQQVYERIMNDEALLTALTAYLGILEDAAIAIDAEYADEEILYRSISFLVPWTFEGLRHYIDEERSRSKDTTLYCELERLSVAWSSGRSLQSGRPVPREVAR
jgi:hypothetical protein